MKENNKTNCHPERSEGSFNGFFGRCPQNDVVTQSGRSMVEMLGVLAVIGVLSVAGIAGYSNAMKKYRANELLNEVSKRATVVAMQIASGKSGEGLSISEFGNNTVQGVNIEVDTSYAGGKTFSFGLAGTVLNDICPKMMETAGDNSFMSIAEGCGTITFKTDLSAGESGSEEPETSNSDCPVGSSINGNGEDTGKKDGNNSCKCNNTTDIYVASINKCEAPNNTCHDEEAIDGSYAGNNALIDGVCYCNTHKAQCGYGWYCLNSVCTPVSGGTKVDGHWVGPKLDWRSANSWCIGKGSSGLITYATLNDKYGCDYDNLQDCNWDLFPKELTDGYWSGKANDDYSPTEAMSVDPGAGIDYMGVSYEFYALCE